MVVVSDVHCSSGKRQNSSSNLERSSGKKNLEGFIINAKWEFSFNTRNPGRVTSNTATVPSTHDLKRDKNLLNSALVYGVIAIVCLFSSHVFSVS